MYTKDILDLVRGNRGLLPPLSIDVQSTEPLANGLRVDALIDISWASKTYRFVCEIKSPATPKVFQGALAQVRQFADLTGLAPLVVFPYLNSSQLEELARLGISGFDLCGNGLVVVPGELFVLRTGKPNRYPADRTIANPYRGTASLIARVFLLRPRYQEGKEIQQELRQRDTQVALSTISKALKTLEEDLLVARRGRSAEVQDPEGIMRRLSKNYRRPRPSATRQYRWRVERVLMISRLAALRSDGTNTRLVVTGAASVDQYTVMAREEKLSLYCESIERVAAALEPWLEESNVFPDLELIETDDPTVYFDARPTDGLPYASPIQCWLELEDGDPRQNEIAQTVKAKILADLETKRALGK